MKTTTHLTCPDFHFNISEKLTYKQTYKNSPNLYSSRANTKNIPFKQATWKIQR